MSVVFDNICKYLPFWEFLTESEKALVRKNCFIEKYSHNSVIYSSSDEPLGLAVIKSGFIKMNCISDKGREIVFYKLQTGNLCLFANVKGCAFGFHTQAMALSNVELLLLNHKIMCSIISKNIYVKSFMYELVSNRLSRIIKVLQQVIFYGAEKRLADYLISEYNRSGSKTVRMTQEEIANEINTAREVVARSIKDLVRNGCVDSIKRGELFLKDIEKLRAC